MGNKNQYPVSLGSLAGPGLSGTPGISWQSTNPSTGFLPINPSQNGGGSAPSGNPVGAMASTNTIYSQILDVSRMDNIGIEVNFNVIGDGTGTFQVMASNSGINFSALTFTPLLSQPAGSALSYVIDLNQYPFKYLMLQYTNSSGTGTLSAYMQCKDVN